MNKIRKFCDYHPFYFVKKLVAKFIEYENCWYLIGLNSIELISEHAGTMFYN